MKQCRKKHHGTIVKNSVIIPKAASLDKIIRSLETFITKLPE